MSMAFFIRCYAAKEEEEPYQKLFFPTRRNPQHAPLLYDDIIGKLEVFGSPLKEKQTKKQKL